jgi:hypothetical protein
MKGKSYVGTGYYICPVCGNKHSESVLIDKRMRDTLTQDMFLGQELCPEDKKKFDEGYIAFVECENSDSTRDKLKQEEAVRTGKIIHVRKEAIGELFDAPMIKTPFVFCTKEVGDMLTDLVTESSDTEPTSTLH